MVVKTGIPLPPAQSTGFGLFVLLQLVYDWCAGSLICIVLQRHSLGEDDGLPMWLRPSCCDDANCIRLGSRQVLVYAPVQVLRQVLQEDEGD